MKTIMLREPKQVLRILINARGRQQLRPAYGILLGIAASLWMTGFAFAAAPAGTFEGNAFGTYTNLKAGPVAATLGFTAFLPCPCLGTGGKTLSNTVESLSAGYNGNVLKAATILSTVTTASSATTASVKNTSRIEGLNVFNGLITADAVLAVATTTADASAIKSSSTESAFVNLRIAGQPVSPDVPQNTRIPLPGVGVVVLKNVVEKGNGIRAGLIIVQMITINITTSNSFGLQAGTQIIIANAKSGFTRATPALAVSGNAWAASSNQAAGNLIRNRIGLTALVTMGCPGTGGKIKTNSIAEVNVNPVLSVGTGKTTAFGGPVTGGAIAKTTATTENVSLLNNLIRAESVMAVAQTAVAGGVRTRSTQGSGFAGLKVLGIPFPNIVPPNTKIILPGLGFVILNEQILPPASSDAPTVVNGLHIRITMSNVLQLPVGAELIVAHAAAAAQTF